MTVCKHPILGKAVACLSHRNVKEHPHYPDILSLRQNRPTLASVSGRWSLLDGMSAIVVGSFYGTNSTNTFDHGLSARYPMRLLFSSIHCYLDPSSGAALCTRKLLELLAGRGMDCRALTTGILNPERETSLDEGLAALELPARRFQGGAGNGRSGRGDRPERQRGPGHAHAHGLQSRRAAARPARVGDFPRAGRAGLRPVPARCAADSRRSSGYPLATSGSSRTRTCKWLSRIANPATATEKI